MAAGLFGYLGYDMVRQMERLPEPNPDVLEGAGRDPDPADRDGGVRRGAGRDLADHPGAPAGRRFAEGGLRDARWRASTRSPAALERPLPARGPHRSDAASISSRRSRTRRRDEFDDDGGDGEGIHPRRRHLPGGAVAALRNALPAARLRALPLACAGSIRRRSCAISTSRTSRSSARRRRSWCGCATARSRSGRSPAPARAAPPPAEDRAHADSLLADQKERAEHLMLLDLGRNDVGRVAEMGSVHGHGFASSSNITAR